MSADVERSRRFYTDVLGGVTVQSGEPTYVAPCYIRDPDGHLIEVGQTTLRSG